MMHLPEKSAIGKRLSIMKEAVKIAQTHGIPHYKIRRLETEDVPYSLVEMGFQTRKYGFLPSFNAVLSWELDWVWSEVVCYDAKYVEVAKLIEQHLRKNGISASSGN